MIGALFLTDAMLAVCELPPIIPPLHSPSIESAWPLAWRPLEHVHINVPEDPWYEGHLEWRDRDFYTRYLEGDES